MGGDSWKQQEYPGLLAELGQLICATGLPAELDTPSLPLTCSQERVGR